MLSGRKAYICSPLSAPTEKEIRHNMEMAKFYLMRMRQIYHCRTFASHAYLPLMLDDTIQEERKVALQIGMKMLRLCDALIICGRRISAGMAKEIKAAFALGIEVFWYDSNRKPFDLIRIGNWEVIADEMQA
ncbi:nucleoside 2-deoxyribosyltransferase [Faecalimonas umbilicata]|nr:nucleoside 2-deoxyribosyltransferase [Faecalimonas umbilicata]